MKNYLFTILLLSFTSLRLVAGDFRVNHGPYLQNVGTESTTIFFTTAGKAFSWVEVDCDAWGGAKRFYAVKDGLVQAYNTRNIINITGLEPGKEYRYRIVAKEMRDFQPYNIVYGDSIATEWESFRTVDNKKSSHSFVVVNDIHDNSGKLRNLLQLSSVGSADVVFFLGDMISHSQNDDVPYKGFIDTSVELFAKNKPFVAVRGNHETRGTMARNYHTYVGCPNDRFYNVLYYGNTAVVILDSGEDKPDTHPVYGGINRFDEYRLEQARWLQKEIKSKRFRKARNRIVLIHIPPFPLGRTVTPEDHAPAHLAELLLPILNKADIDLVLSGHTHRHYFIEKGLHDNDFPLLVNDNNSVVDMHLDEESIRVKVTAADGTVTFEKEF